MAIDWLDVVRFADTIGYHSDTPRNVWPYPRLRDPIFQPQQAFRPSSPSSNSPATCCRNSTQEQKVASCFNRAAPDHQEGGARKPKDYEARMLADRVRAVGTGLARPDLGLLPMP